MTSPFDVNVYGKVFGDLLSEQRMNPLDCGTPNEGVGEILKGLSSNTAFGSETVMDDDMAKACISAVWLYHNFLDESHTLSQQINTSTGSFWHGIMHRREPDFSNSKYWFQKVGEHETFPEISEAATELSEGAEGAEGAGRSLANATWDPFGFVDLCEAGLKGDASLDSLCRQVQQREWEILFHYSYEKAIGR
jgi:hypothetical protein